MYVPSLPCESLRARAKRINAASLWGSSAQNAPTSPLTSSICGRRTAPPPSAGCEGVGGALDRQEGLSVARVAAPGRVTRRSGGEEGVGEPVPHRPSPGLGAAGFPQRSRSVCDSHFTGVVQLLLFLRGRWGRGGSAALRRGAGAVSARADSPVINAGFRGGRFPWQRGARRRPASWGCGRLRCGWSFSLRPPRQPASSCSWSSSSSSPSTSAPGLSTSPCPRTVN